MKAYKVTTKGRLSCTVRNKFRVKYEVGKFVFPSIPKSGLFVFRSLGSARYFVGSENWDIWECEVPSLKRLYNRTDFESRVMMARFWEQFGNRKQKDGFYVCNTPSGTHIAPKVKLIKKVK